MKSLRIGFIGIGTYGGALLDGILMAASQHDDHPIAEICIYDIDKKRIQKYRDQPSPLVVIAKNGKEVLDKCDLHVVGVNSSQLPGLFDELGLHEVSTYSVTEEFLFMDGCNQVESLTKSGCLKYGKIMFTPWTRYCQGIVGFFPGMLEPKTVGLLEQLLPMLGKVWIAESPSFLQLIRATAGTSTGLSGKVFTSFRDSFIQMGLTQEQADQALISLVRGLAIYLEDGGKIEQLAGNVCSSENSLTKIMLDSPYVTTIEEQIPLVFKVLNAISKRG